MRFGSLIGFFVGACLLAQSLLFFVIPVMGTSVFMSPDETAVAVAARTFGSTGSMRIVDRFLTDAPWAHPRSYVTQGEAMVPVGFLGFPALLGIIWKIVGEWGLIVCTPLLALSVLWPLWRLAQPFGRIGQIAVAFIWMSFPTVTLYANRGLFPNLAVVCFAVWAVYLIQKRDGIASLIAAGVCSGLALAIRPTEAVWVLPWLAASWAFSRHPSPPNKRNIFAAFLVSFLIVSGAAALVAWKTYGSPFAIGYALRDPIISSETQQAMATPPEIRWPFGVHPRNVWFHIRTYFFGFLGPWVALTFLAMLAYAKKREARPFYAVGAWTFVSLVAVYGQTIYQDHVGINVPSFGNSFLRYVLPMAPVFAIAIGSLVAWMTHRWNGFRGVMISMVTIVICVAFGNWTASQRDDENVFDVAHVLQNYHQIQAMTRERIDSQAVIFSERSDKLFFPTYRVATPLPQKEIIRSLAKGTQMPVMLFSSTLDEAHMKPWNEAELFLLPIFQIGNQTMYEVI